MTKHLLLFVMLLLIGCSAKTLQAGYPDSGSYCRDNSKIFWFIQIADTHIGTRGNKDADNLNWLVNEANLTIAPSFIVLAGDITDSTDGNILGWPDGPYQSEWDEYRQIVDSAPIDPTSFFDIPGNHDHYNDRDFQFYLANSVQGSLNGSTQASWTRQFGFGKYHFLGLNTAANDGDPFSIFFPFGDHAGLDNTELNYAEAKLQQHHDADLTILFGHHPLDETGDFQDTWILYGAPQLATLLDQYGVSLYGYGHTHRQSEKVFQQGVDYTSTQPFHLQQPIFYFNTASLGKSVDGHFTLVAIDCNGLSTTTQAVREWPLVQITTPVDRDLGTSGNPLQYLVPHDSDIPIRALIFDPSTVTTVQYRIDAGNWISMTRSSANDVMWEASWSSVELSDGVHQLEVQANGSNMHSDLIQFEKSALPPQCNLDVDGNQIADALTDGLLTIRDAFGFSGSTLTLNAIATDCQRCTASQLEEFLQTCSRLGLRDIDGNGVNDALTDGLLTIRYEFGFRGDTLINNATATNCTRCNAADIESYLAALVP